MSYHPKERKRSVYSCATVPVMKIGLALYQGRPIINTSESRLVWLQRPQDNWKTRRATVTTRATVTVTVITKTMLLSLTAGNSFHLFLNAILLENNNYLLQLLIVCRIQETD
jgi:hypothetical protein